MLSKRQKLKLKRGTTSEASNVKDQSSIGVKEVAISQGPLWSEEECIAPQPQACLSPDGKTLQVDQRSLVRYL